MRKAWCAVLMIMMVMVSGCTINFATEKGKTDPIQISNPHSIQVTIYKRYEDGVELKFQLLNAKNVKGTWTIQECGQEEVQTNKGAMIIYGVKECTIPEGHENDKSYYTIYIKFTGTVNGEKVTSDKLHVLDYDKIEKFPLERQNPNSQWIMLQNFIKTGYLYGASVHIGSTRAEIIDFFGEPDKSDSQNILDYREVQFTMYGERVGEIKMINTKESPIDVPNNDKDDIIRVFGNPD